MLCPIDCSTCRDALCRADGCKLTGEPMLDICFSCGEVAVHSMRIVICAGCLSDEPARPASGLLAQR